MYFLLLFFFVFDNAIRNQFSEKIKFAEIKIRGYDKNSWDKIQRIKFNFVIERDNSSVELSGDGRRRRIEK